MNKSSKKKNIQTNFFCQKCSCIPLLGINFSFEKKGKSEILSNTCELFSYCIYDNKSIEKILINKINFSEISENNKEIECESCKILEVEYHCFDCKRNICKKCFEYHKNHKFYYNREYISEKELAQIKDDYNKSQKNLDKNLKMISKQIDEYESQLKELKALYKDYKEINEKLKIFSDYILNLYINKVNNRQNIYFPFYFNFKNILLFNPIEINLPDNNISIKSYTNALKDKLISGFYNIIKNSNFSENLSDYNNSENRRINYDIIKLEKFNKREFEYDKIVPFAENKFFGIKSCKNDDNNNKRNEFKVDIYNIKMQNIETTLKIIPEKVFYSEKNNLLIILSKRILYILNPKNFSITQKILADQKIKVESDQSPKNRSRWQRVEVESPEPGNIIFAQIVSQNSFITIFEGDFRCLGEEYTKMLHSDSNNIVNLFEHTDCHNEDYKDYSFLITYEKNNDKYEPNKIIYLVRNEILTNEVSYVTGKYCELDIDEYPGDTYCSFNFEDIFQISENKFILKYESKIESDRDQEYYYITDKNYKDEIIYYYLDIKDQNKIESTLISTNENSYLYKNEKDEIFYFLYKDSDYHTDNLENCFTENNYKFQLIKFSHPINDINKLFIERNSIIISNSDYIYFGKIFGDKLEIISHIDSNSIVFISLEEKCFYCSEEGKMEKSINKRKNKNFINQNNGNNFDNSDNSDNSDDDEDIKSD